jgi:integrase
VRRAGLKGQGRLSLHSLRHGYASLLIAQRLDVVFVSCQLGHANANVTLSVYAHLFAQREHGEVARQALQRVMRRWPARGARGLPLCRTMQEARR